VLRAAAARPRTCRAAWPRCPSCRVRGAGNYGDIYLRNLGPETPLDPDRGPNKAWNLGGGVLASPPFRWARAPATGATSSCAHASMRHGDMHARQDGRDTPLGTMAGAPARRVVPSHPRDLWRFAPFSG
jgi:hypothetical protein